MRGILPPTMPGANPRFTMYGYDLNRAKAEFKLAGYKPGQLKLTMLFIDSPDTDRVADSIQQDLGRLGVDVTLKPVSADTAYNEVYTPGKSAFTLFHWGQDYPDPSDFVDPILTCSASSNAAFYCNHSVDRLADQARADTNRAHRYATYRRIERLIMADAPWVPLYADILYDFHGARVKGFFIHPVWPFVYDQYRLSS
jgi:ABC-type transport system substrate-binding protein